MALNAMQVHSLSPTSLWIEMPLTPNTPRMVWRALAAAGLNEGRINSYSPEFFEPGVPEHTHLVQGSTASGLFRDNARIVVELLPENGGTRLEVAAARTDGEFDLGFRLRALKRHYTRAVKEFLQATSTTPVDEESLRLPPLASPQGQHEPPRFVEAHYSAVVPIRRTSLRTLQGVKEALKENWEKPALSVALPIIGVWVASHLGLLGPVLLFYAIWRLWSWKKNPKPNFIWFFFLLWFLTGLWRTGVLLQRYF